MKTIGLIGGISAESSAEYYRLINQEAKRRLGGHNNARSLMLTVNFQEIEALQRADQWDAIADELRRAAWQLQAGGADCIALCCNTLHKLAAEIENATTIPFLHIADPTAQAIKARGMHTVGLIGTSITMEHDFYRDRLRSRHGLSVQTPAAADRELVHRVILDELCHGKVLEDSRRQFQRVIRDLHARGAQGVILGCTEIPMLVRQEDSSLPLFDTTRLHAEAAVAFAIGA